MPAKIRIDQLLVDRGLASSRNKAQAMLLAGEVIVNDQRIDKAGTKVSSEAELRLRQRNPHYASRAAAKLLGGLEAFAQMQIKDRVCLDAGASTGGFVDVLLHADAKRVYAVDVGYGQLDERLRKDPRVIVRDRCNLRYLSEEQVPEKIDLVTLDLSFISITKVLDSLMPFLSPHAQLLCLVKPQFEVGREHIGKGGVVRDAAARQMALDKVRDHALSLGLHSLGAIDSPLPGAKSGNVEFLLALQRDDPSGKTAL